MSNFKYKPNRIKFISEINTLDSTHKKYVNDFQKKNSLLEQLYQQKNELEQQLLEVLKTANLVNSDDKKKINEGNESTFTYIKKKSSIKDELQGIDKQICDIMNNHTELTYYSETYDILIEYYDNNIYTFKNNDVNKEQDQDILTKLNKKSLSQRKYKKNTKKRLQNTNATTVSILDYFQKNYNDQQINRTYSPSHSVKLSVDSPCERSEKSNVRSQKNIISEDIQQNSGENQQTSASGTSKICINDGCSTSAGDGIPIEKQIVITYKNKASLYNEYMHRIHKIKPTKLNQNISCSKCNLFKYIVQADGILVCPSCGQFSNSIIESEVVNFKEQKQEKANYPYKRINHFIEWLSQFQAKETTEISQEIFDKITEEIKKYKIKNDDLTNHKLKMILKKLHLHNYYEHIPFIINKITGIPSPTISQEVEEMLKSMFKEIQIPFSTHCPRSRVNFLSYSYVLHKFCQLLELDEFIKCFPLLKSREKLRVQDKLWKQICDDLQWAYYPSI